MSARLCVLLLALLPACAHGSGRAEATPPSSFDPAAPTGGIVAPGQAPEVAPTSDMEHMSFEEEPGPAEHVQGQPKREPIPSFQLFGTRGEGPG